MQALEGIHRLRDDQAFVSFLFTIASRNVKRQRWRKRLFGDYHESVIEEREHSDPLPDVQADVVILRQAMQKLPAKMHEAIVLFEINGLSLEEVRKIQGGSLSGVKSRLARGRQQLSRILEVSEEPVVLSSQSPKKTKATPIVHQQTVV